MLSPTQAHAAMRPAERSISDFSVRLSVGLEAADDPVEELDGLING
jgi:cystathionine beta-lyase/cystathionine gamma-synthase